MSGVVVGYDGSDSALSALEWAFAEAGLRGTELTVLGAGNISGPALAVGAAVQDFARQLAEEGASRARELPGAVAAQVLSASSPGGAAAALVEASRTADLVVVGNRGRGAVASAMLGSVAFTVTAAAACPVVVVHAVAASGESTTGSSDAAVPHPGPQAPVVVGVDGSVHTAEVVAFAAATAQRYAAPLHVVAAWMTPEVVDAGFAVLDYQGLIDAEQRAAQDAAKVAAEVGRARAEGLHVVEIVVQQPAAPALIEASRSAGLLVVGARGHGAVSGLFLGSVSHAVIHRAPCPVAVVRDAEGPT